MPDSNTLRWGILGAARIAVQKVVPAMQATSRASVIALASRELGKAQRAASELGIPSAYGSYEELIDDPAIDAIYNPLPNHLHVPWTLRAAAAGKHVLCEKPIALSAAEARLLREARAHTGVVIGEAFMVRVHPQWLGVKGIVDEGRIGDVRLITGHFSYYRRDPNDVRSKVAFGGGALLDIGCYPILLSRWLFGTEPIDVVAQIDRDPDLHIDRLSSAMLRFPSGQATFSCATQIVPFQRMTVFGERGRIEIEIPFNAPPDRACRIIIDDGSRLASEAAQRLEYPVVDQYTLQAERFADAVAGQRELPVSLDDSIANMATIDALFRSADSGGWERPSES